MSHYIFDNWDFLVDVFSNLPAPFIQSYDMVVYIFVMNGLVKSEKMTLRKMTYRRGWLVHCFIDPPKSSFKTMVFRILFLNFALSIFYACCSMLSLFLFEINVDQSKLNWICMEIYRNPNNVNFTLIHPKET